MEITTRSPVVVSLGTTRSSRSALLAAHAIGAQQYCDLTSRWGVVARRQLPLALARLPDVVVLHVPTVAPADLMQVMARLERDRRELVVLTDSHEALALSFALGFHGVDTRSPRPHRPELAAASAIIAALRDHWPPRRLLPAT